MGPRCYRIDKFRVPPAARNECLEAIHNIELFQNRTLPACFREVAYEQTSGPGAFNIVTIAEWESAEATENAKQAAAARYTTTGFNPAEIMAGLGIEADMAIYIEKPSEV